MAISWEMTAMAALAPIRVKTTLYWIMKPALLLETMMLYDGDPTTGSGLTVGASMRSATKTSDC